MGVGLAIGRVHANVDALFANQIGETLLEQQRRGNMSFMATAASAAQVVKTPGVRGGKARIDGTRVCVVDVVRHHQRGAIPAQIVEAFPSLTLVQVKAALAYFDGHRQEIEAQLAEDLKAAEDDERRWHEMLAQHGGRPPADPTPEERMIPRPFLATSKK